MKSDFSSNSDSTGIVKTSGLGTFGGVYTPSILTILGVIMYLRFGWVVGNAGLIGTLTHSYDFHFHYFFNFLIGLCDRD